MSEADSARLLLLIEKLQGENERLRQQAKVESHSRLMAEDALGKTEDRLQLALDAAGLAMWEWNLAQGSVFTTAGFARMVGDPGQPDAADQSWRTQDLMALVLEADRPMVRQALVDVVKKTVPRLEVEFRLNTSVGPVWVECLGEVVQRSMLDEAEILVGVVRDVTRRREIQEEVEAARAEAVAANAAKDEFLAHMSHEIRTPLNGVLGMNGLLAKTVLSADQRQYVELVDSSGQALLGLVNDLLDYSRIHAHKLVLEQIRFPLQRWLWQVTQPQRLAAKAKGLELTVTSDGALPKEMVGDPGRLGQVMINLLSNAIKFTDSGRIDVAMGLGAATGAEHHLLLQVRDTGIGIAPEKQQLVFGAFTQADSSTSRRFGGTGLGLSICEQLIGLMGGSITLESQVGRGSCFTVVVPLGEMRDDLPTTQFGLEGFGDANAPSGDELTTQSGSSAGATEPYTGMHALVVDDHTVNQLLATKLLQRLGFTVAVAENGLQGVQAVRLRAYDLVLMDIQMPVLDGRMATREVRLWEAQQQRRRTPIVALSAHASSSDRDEALACGMDGYLSKPLLPEALATMLKAVLQPQDVASVIAAQADVATGLGVVNRARLLVRLGGDEALLHSMAQAFCTDLRERMARIHAALQKQEWPVVGAQAHALHGSLLTLTADEAARSVKTLERAALAQDGTAAHAAFVELSRAAKAVYDVVITW